jgi:hypothetical protein
MWQTRFTDYKDARKVAQELANRIGHDVGIWRAKEFGKDGYNIRSLPKPQNRFGHELQCEVVSPITAPSP